MGTVDRKGPFEDFRIKDMVSHIEGESVTGVRIHFNALANEGCDRVHGHMVMETPPGWSRDDLRMEMVKMMSALEREYCGG